MTSTTCRPTNSCSAAAILDCAAIRAGISRAIAAMLFSLEERYFSDIYIARIVRLGFAAFVDAGRTWFSDSPDDHGYGALADVGFGLRFESTRTRQDRVLHVDFAFPLVDGPDVQTMQILLS